MSRRIQGIKKKLASISNDKSFFLEQGRQETTLTARRVRNADFYVPEYEKAKLKDKQYLRSLRLEWDSEAKMDETEAIVGYEMSLEGLQPHQNIQNLRLTNYGEYISNTNNVSEDLVGSTTTLLPSLESLWLWDLPNLKGWWREEIEVHHSCFDANANANEDNHSSLPYYLPSLSKLYIEDCPKLTCMPLYPRLEGGLELRKTSWKPLEETFRMRMMMSSNVGSVFPTTPSFSPLSKLERLSLRVIDDLECLPDSFKSLTSLISLEIGGCPKLKDLCPGILHLSSLQHLQISKCVGLGDMLISDDYDFMWQSLNGTLGLLELCTLPNIVTVLPKGIQHLTSLQELQVFFCDSLTTIPGWIHNLKSLERLYLWSCPNLTSFPEGIRSLTTLNLLYIDSCPMLLKRCKRNTGEDWDKISHIEDLTLIPDPNKEQENESAFMMMSSSCLAYKMDGHTEAKATIGCSCGEDDWVSCEKLALCIKDFDLASVSRKVFEDVVEFTRIRDKPGTKSVFTRTAQVSQWVEKNVYEEFQWACKYEVTWLQGNHYENLNAQKMECVSFVCIPSPTMNEYKIHKAMDFLSVLRNDRFNGLLQLMSSCLSRPKPINKAFIDLVQEQIRSRRLKRKQFRNNKKCCSLMLFFKPVYSYAYKMDEHTEAKAIIGCSCGEDDWVSCEKLECGKDL
ncbi:hypothetical protein G4B88_029553 [Cannabis sativa]|uniref:Uncharacterized protein n=1 Tax=Cannabis sativa TaxID=3483 RepID=A0A7J6EAI3_CANSA|nr:hypothetical protein G4B88_029553 [Cannabis sativa]